MKEFSEYLTEKKKFNEKKFEKIRDELKQEFYDLLVLMERRTEDGYEMSDIEFMLMGFKAKLYELEELISRI